MLAMILELQSSTVRYRGKRPLDLSQPRTAIFRYTAQKDLGES